MFEIAKTAKKMIMKLNEIQPAVSVAGMDETAAKIKEMKIEMVMMIASISPDHPCMARVLIALREDMVSSGAALHDLLDGDKQITMSDGELQVAMIAAENFVARTRDYLDSKRKAFELSGGNYGRA